MSEALQIGIILGSNRIAREPRAADPAFAGAFIGDVLHRLVARVGFEAGKALSCAIDSPAINDLANAKAGDASRSGVESGGFGPAFGPTPQPTLHPTRPLQAPAATPMTLEIARAKLDAAIAAEAWDAVKVIGARVRELEREDIVVLDAERAKRRT